MFSNHPTNVLLVPSYTVVTSIPAILIVQPEHAVHPFFPTNTSPQNIVPVPPMRTFINKVCLHLLVHRLEPSGMPAAYITDADYVGQSFCWVVKGIAFASSPTKGSSFGKCAHILVCSVLPTTGKICRRLQLSSTRLSRGDMPAPIHKEDQLYDCVQTRERTFYGSSVTRHLRIHTGCRPFSCCVCDKQFQRPDHVVAHARRIHGLSETRSRTLWKTTNKVR